METTHLKLENITPIECLLGLKKRTISGVLDVRSEGEYEDGALPYSINAPILNNIERHLVGTEYKKSGQSAAIELGITLTGPHKDQRTGEWKKLSNAGAIGAVICWRGGLRSKISQEWLRDVGGDIPRVEGGYKALRGELLKVIAQPPTLIVIGGWTGSGKTKLLEELRVPKVDLEKLAVHRGSCFGERLNGSGRVDQQPSQATFENNIAFEMWQEKGPIAIEDESTRIGGLNVPQTLKEQMKLSDVVFVEATEDVRAGNIYQEYIAGPISAGVPSEVVAQFFLERLKFLKRHLGGLEHDRFAREIREAFNSDHKDRHLNWIRGLLVRHYDKSYQFAFERLNRRVIYRGPLSECRDFLESSYRSH